MIDIKDAERLIEDELKARQRDTSNPLMIVKSTEYEFGWVFYWNSKKYLETNNFFYSQLGNAPFIVNKTDGSIHSTGTAHSIEYYVEEYRKKIS